MKRLIFIILVIIENSHLQAQTKNRISLEINYGIGGNFFVRSYDETRPIPVAAFYNKNFIGSIGGFEVKYNITNNSSLNLAFARSVNKREITYDIGGNVTILYFHISHINNFYQLFYETALSKKIKYFKVHGGIYYLRMSQQEVDVTPVGALFEERDFEHNKLEEGGVFLGIHFLKKSTQNLI